ncbi:MAG: type II secretion system protein GspL [Burkholderiaceae bacterium]|nr:type II secretion system protein GspL [Burkholderiaceae bacterium]
MAAQVLRKGQAIVWVPPRAIGERAFATEPVLLAMLPVAVSDKVGGAANPGGLPVTVFGSASTARYVRVSLDALPVLETATLVFDARDVNLLQVVVPALSGARLQQALPNVVEEMLLQDPQSCAYAVGPRVGAEGRRLVAAIDRGWLEFVVGAFERRGIAVQGAWPAQLALPVGADRTALACLNDGLALCTGLLDGIGWSASSDPDSRAEAIMALLASAGTPSAPFAPPAADAAPAAVEEEAVVGLAARELPSEPPRLRRRLAVFVEDASWQTPVLKAASRAGFDADIRALPFPLPAPVDLLAARRGSAAGRWFADVDWRAWRAAAIFGGVSVAAALFGLNLHWGALAQERAALKAQTERTFREAFPNTPVVIEPLMQMQREVAGLRTRAGQAGPDDFLPLLTRFSLALGAQGADSTASVEYREARLRVRFQPGFFEARSVREILVRDCQRQGLSVKFDGEREPTATVALLR